MEDDSFVDGLFYSPHEEGKSVDEETSFWIYDRCGGCFWPTLPINTFRKTMTELFVGKFYKHFIFLIFFFKLVFCRYPEKRVGTNLTF